MHFLGVRGALYKVNQAKLLILRVELENIFRGAAIGRTHATRPDGHLKPCGVTMQ